MRKFAQVFPMRLLNYRMRSYKKLFFLLPLFLLACKNKNEPQGIISQDDMVGILVDVHIIDGSLFEMPQQPDTLYKYSINKYLNTFKSHHTDSATFRRSYAYYARKPDELLAIYDKVLPILKGKVDSLAKIRVKADSLLRIKQNQLNEKLAKRAADSIARINKRKADSLKELSGQGSTRAPAPKQKTL